MNLNKAMETLLEMWEDLPLTEKLTMTQDIYGGFLKTVMNLECSENKGLICPSEGLIWTGENIMKSHIKNIKDYMEQYVKLIEK